MNTATESNNVAIEERPIKKILIVEDDEKIAKALAIRLRTSGYDVTVAPDAVLGLSSALKTKPDLTLLDICLPAGNGFTVADRIQELLPTASPFIFITASRQPDLRKKAKLLGAAAFFEKPYEPDELLAAIDELLAE